MPKHILAVDDERNILRLVEVNLLRAGYRVTTASDGQEALEKLDADPPDMLVLDVMMPRMDGFALLKRLKQDAARAEIPVLLLTAKAQDRDIFEGWTLGCHGYLTKPFNPAELLTWVKKTFESLEPAAGGGGRIRL
jgi:two-component system alkaline phosphatase synthesis response regulator PhoP/two-component system response regulator VicR